MKVVFRPAALAPLDAIFDYIQEQSPQGAARVKQTIFKRILQLEKTPLIGRPAKH